MCALFISSYTVRILVFLSLVSVFGADARKENNVDRSSNDTILGATRDRIASQDLVAGKNSTELTLVPEAFKPDAELSSKNAPLKRKKRCIFTLMAASGVAAVSNTLRKRRPWLMLARPRPPRVTRRPFLLRPSRTTPAPRTTTTRRPGTTRKAKTGMVLSALATVGGTLLSSIFKPNSPGKLVIDKHPSYNVANATKITNVTETIRPNGMTVLEFVHPTTGEKIQLPLNAGDEIVNPHTRQVYLIFVDRTGATFFVPKPTSTSLRNETSLLLTYNELSRQKGWGCVAIAGSPKYNLSNAIYVEERGKTIDSNGVVVLQFVHPITRQEIRIPETGGDEYVNPSNSKVYVIFVDARGRTLLIFKGTDSRPGENVTPVDFENGVVDQGPHRIVSREPTPGTVVQGGFPHYDLSNALFVEKIDRIREAHGTEMIQFVHPITRVSIRIPVNGGDEYVSPSTSEVYVIYVDAQGRTLLVFKGERSRSLTSQTYMQNFGVHSSNVNQNPASANDKYDKLSRDRHWGSVVRGGVPRYDITRATLVENPERIVDEDKYSVLQFVHPISKQTIRIPSEGGDEYVAPSTHRIYVIFVDIQGRTLLIFKGFDWSLGIARPAGQYSFTSLPSNDQEQMGGESVDGGKLVIGGLPRYDTVHAIRILEPMRIYGRDGMPKLEFGHPSLSRKIEISPDTGDEYIDLANGRTFAIFVSNEGQTFLVFKRAIPSLLEFKVFKDITGTSENVHPPKSGSVVVNGIPPYDVSKAVSVLNTKRWIASNGAIVIVFVHPMTRQTIRINATGAEKYFDFINHRIFVIFIDQQGRTFLIFKEYIGAPASALAIAQEHTEMRVNANANININRNVNENIILPQY